MKPFVKFGLVWNEFCKCDFEVVLFEIYWNGHGEFVMNLGFYCHI